MKFTHQFTVRAPLAEVANFHRVPANMRALTPPPVFVQMHSAPPLVQEGDRSEFTLWFGPLPVRWTAQFEQIDDEGFVDHQVRGPFNLWVHRHRFEMVDAHTTRVHDELEGEFAMSLLPKLIGAMMWGTLPLLFRYRAWRTRAILERHPTNHSAASEQHAS